MSANTNIKPVETPAPKPLEIVRGQVSKMEDQFKAALPAHVPVERFMRVLLTACQNTPDLLNANRPSLLNAAMRAAQDGLLPDGREGAIVIYNSKIKGGDGGKDQWIKKCQWMPMVAGILKKVRNSNQIAMITARVVYGGDQYRYWLDEQGEHLLYEPAENPDRNIVRRVFAAARTKDGELIIEPLSPEDIEKIRAVSRAKDSGPWVDWWEEMAKKSAIRRLSKRLPMSTDLEDLIRRDDEVYDLGSKRDQAEPDKDAAKPTSIGSAFDRLALKKPESEPAGSKTGAAEGRVIDAFSQADQAWLSELSIAFNECDNLFALSVVQIDKMNPKQNDVSKEAWDDAMETLRRHVDRISAAADEPRDEQTTE